MQTCFFIIIAAKLFLLMKHVQVEEFLSVRNLYRAIDVCIILGYYVILLEIFGFVIVLYNTGEISRSF